MFKKADIEVIVTDQYADCFIKNEICIIAQVNGVSVFLIKKFERFFTCAEITEIAKEVEKMVHKKLTQLMAAGVILNKSLES
jgi:hypothetical protein